MIGSLDPALTSAWLEDISQPFLDAAGPTENIVSEEFDTSIGFRYLIFKSIVLTYHLTL